MRVYRIHPSDSTSSYLPSHRVTNEGVWYLAPWLIIDFFYKRRKLPLNAPSLASLVSEVVLSLLVYDFLFYFGHRFLHANKGLYSSLHAKHHKESNIRAVEAIRHTFLDGSLNTAFSVLALRITRAHPLSRAVYNVVAIAMLADAHSGYNLPWALSKVIPFRLVGGAVEHEKHHRVGNKIFATHFTYLDYLFGTN